ncbi:Lon protease family protein [Heyndrickxia acidiproducens]|uniref:Lon protease family protein n=1 Tax=Heyndrickxia acidiproducens TaxID=1121084 RepID=UPI0003671045|nr:AAA family ATPase [Heyndrickxia acidiproducens]
MNEEAYQTVLSAHQVPVSQLRTECSPAQFSFETTAELESVPNEMIGQQRAEQAMDFGLSVEQTGYNLFVVGPAGTGRMTYTQHSVNKLAKTRQVPDDWCYVNNFENPDRPLVIALPAGNGLKFQHKMENLLMEIEREIRAAFSNEETEKKKRSIVEQSQNQVEALWKETESFASDLNFKLERTSAGIQSIPLFFDRPMEKQEYEQLSAANKEKVKEREKQLGEKINDTVYQIHKIEEELRKNLEQFNKQTAAFAIEGLFQPLREAYQAYPKVLDYLEAYHHDVVGHFSIFLKDREEENAVVRALTGSKEQQLHRYAVNLFVSHKNRTGAPVIYETNPTYQNLFGKVEYRGALGSWTTDFTFVKPGAIHLANGGYLILQAAELLQQPFAWTLLKRALQTGKIQVENPFEERGAFPTSGLKPEPIPLQIKVIIIGSYYLYDLLSGADEDFHKLFKVKVEFDTAMKRDHGNRMKMAHFIKNYAERKHLLPFHRRAVAKVIDHSSRLADEQGKLTTRFQDITKLLVESSYWAKKEEAAFVDTAHIKKALAEQSHRANHISEQYREMITNGTIMIETDGTRIGQINGLAVMGTRDATFGIPTKITAQTFVGKSGIMNIERETSLSGQIHNKGLMILTGFLSGVFAKNDPIPLSASITFEQTYSRIDGDSASSTELYVLLSSLAEVPIHQGIAVTGSVNQWGEIQPIGGVNEKIEGFYAICKEQGLTGRQGVIIPQQNMSNLMLNDEVIAAVKAGRFHIWAVRHISEGIEILTGESAGADRGEENHFPDGTIFAKVEERFKKMYESVKQAKQ